MTDDHRWPVRCRTRNGTLGKIEVRRTHSFGQEGYIMRSAPYVEAPLVAAHSDAFVRMVAWYVTEGTLVGRAGITITQSVAQNPEYVAAIRRDISEIGAQPSPDDYNAGRPRDDHGRLQGARPGLWVSEGCDRRSDVVAFHLSGEGTADLLACAPGADKVPTMAFLLSLTQAQLAIFVDTMQAGDGTPRKRHFYQHLPARMDAYSVAATLAGHSPSIDSAGTTCSLNGHKQKHREVVSNIGKTRRREVHYRGTIWCPVTKSGHWMARRNGRIFVTGNTDQDGNTLQSMPTTTTVTFIPSAAAPTANLGARFIVPSTSGATTLWGPYVPLAAGDGGARLVNDFTTSAANTGNWSIVLQRPLAVIPCVTAGNVAIYDMVEQVAGMEKILDTACLSAYLYAPAATATTIAAGFQFAWG